MHALSTTAPLAALPRAAAGAAAHSPRTLMLLQVPILRTLRLAWPLALAVLRMGVAVGGGWLALRLTGSLQGVFLALGAGLLALGLGNAAAVAGGAWFRGDRS